MSSARRKFVRTRRETGIALITALLILLLVSSIIIGMCWMVMSDQRMGGNNSDRQAAFYAAEAGMEKMTADIGQQYTATNALSSADITTVMSKPPVIPGVTYTNASGTSGYLINYTRDANGNPAAQNHTILTGPYAGLQGLLTPFNLTVTARLNSGAEAKLTRTVQTVGIPVFQFGIFSQNDLSYFPGPNFDFGGRVHTNSNLWLAAGATLTFEDKVTAVGQVILTNLSNGHSTSSGYGGTVMVDTVPETSYAQLSQGSVLGNSVVGSISTQTNSAWPSISTGTFNGDILSGSTGASQLTLTVATPGVGGTPIELIRRPVSGENVSNPTMLAERYFSLASLRIMLSDYDSTGSCANADMMGLPGVTAGAPVDLETLAWNSSTGKPVASDSGTFLNGLAGVYPLPTSYGAAAGGAYSGTNGYWISADRPIITGCIKIEFQSLAGGSWTDVTQEILKQGFTGRNLNPLSSGTMSVAANKVPNQAGLPGAQVAPSACADPSPNAVIRLARLRDNPSSANNVGGCGIPTQIGTDYWPNSLFDTREGTSRDIPPPSVSAGAGNGTNSTPITAAGVMDYVELDVNNLSKWFRGTLGSNGPNANNTTGYTVYFSDRRGSRVDPTLGRNTASFGFNDYVNQSDPTNGCPNSVIEQGEDLVGDGVRRTYGRTQLPFVTTSAIPNYSWS
jgi:PilX N-terminal